MLKRKSKTKRKKKTKTSGNVSTDVETSILDSSAVSEPANDDIGTSAAESHNIASNHKGDRLRNDVMPPKPVLPAVDGDLMNFIDGLESMDSVQVRSMLAYSKMHSIDW